MVVAATLGVVGVLMGRTQVGRDLFDSVGDRAGGTVAVAAVSSFDPQGNDGVENQDQLGALTDDDPATTWSTVRYNSRDLGGLKDGVGVVLELGGVHQLTSLDVASPSRGWAASVYVAEQPAGNLQGWGPPVATQSGIEGSASFALDGARGGAVLVWITDLGDGSVGPRFSTALGSAELS